MKARRLTWLHSCLLGWGRHDYRADTVLPPALAWSNTLFKETEWTRDEKPGSLRPQLLFLFCWCYCFSAAGAAVFSTGVTWRARATFTDLCCAAVPEQKNMYGQVTAVLDLSLKCFILVRGCLFLVWVCSEFSAAWHQCSLHLVCESCFFLPTAVYSSLMSSKFSQDTDWIEKFPLE